MKHARKAAAVCAAALTLSLSLTGCNPLRFIFPFGGQPQETTAPGLSAGSVFCVMRYGGAA